MTNYAGTWGLCVIYQNYYRIHPDDRPKFTDAQWGAIIHVGMWHCLGETDDGYMILCDYYLVVRVKPREYTVLPTPKYKYGDIVQDKEQPERVGIVHAMVWHYKRGKEFYHLIIDGRKAGKRYFSEDLDLIQSAEDDSAGKEG